MQENPNCDHIINSVTLVDKKSRKDVMNGRFTRTKHFGLAAQTALALYRDNVYGLPNMSVDFRKEFQLELIEFCIKLFNLPTTYKIKEIGWMVSGRYPSIIKGEKPSKVFTDMITPKQLKEAPESYNPNKRGGYKKNAKKKNNDDNQDNQSQS